VVSETVLAERRKAMDARGNAVWKPRAASETFHRR